MMRVLYRIERPFASSIFIIYNGFLFFEVKIIHFAKLMFTLNSHDPQQNFGHSLILGFLFFLRDMV
jgi:hypothetical protein